MKRPFLKSITVLAWFLAVVQGSAAEGGFSGIGVNMGNLYRLSEAKTRSISPENFTGEKGKAGMSTDGPARGAARDLGQGWKVSPYVHVKAKSTFTLAEIDGPGAIQHIWFTPAPLDRTRWMILRMYWDGETTPSVEVPVGGFFGCGFGPHKTLERAHTLSSKRNRNLGPM